MSVRRSVTRRVMRRASAITPPRVAADCSAGRDARYGRLRLGRARSTTSARSSCARGILAKQGPLIAVGSSPQITSAIRSTGASLVPRSADRLRPRCRTFLHHHERWDGRRLSAPAVGGTEIPMRGAAVARRRRVRRDDVAAALPASPDGRRGALELERCAGTSSTRSWRRGVRRGAGGRGRDQREPSRGRSGSRSRARPRPRASCARGGSPRR